MKPNPRGESSNGTSLSLAPTSWCFFPLLIVLDVTLETLAVDSQNKYSGFRSTEMGEGVVSVCQGLV